MSTTIAGPALPRLHPVLVVMPDGEDGTGRIVKDPRSRRFFRFDHIEGFILERLDGEHTTVDIQVELASWLGEDFAQDEIEEFLDSLRDKGLIEQSGPLLPANAPQLGQQVVAALESSDFQLRSAHAPTPPGLVPARRNLAEAQQFDEAIARLREGKFHAALRAFDEILSANPHNQRAAAIRGLLMQAGSAAATKAIGEQVAPKRSRSVLYYQIPFFNPDPLFAALAPAVRLIWTRGFAICYVALLAAAGWIAATHYREMFTAVPPMSGATWAVGLALTVICLTTLHEFAHGLTCKHFGGRVPELGFMLIFMIMPALYVDVTDAWLFRWRRQRVLVGAAGPLFDLASVSTAVLLWRLSPPGPARLVALFVIIVSGTSFVMNLNPLIKLDGYYILSDVAGIPNLRDVASDAFIGAARRMFGTGGALPAPAQRSSAQRVLVVYGILALAYSAFLLWILFRLLILLSASLAGLWGPALIATGAVVLMRRPLKLIAAALAARLGRASATGALKAAVVLAGLGLVAVIPWPLRVSGPALLDSRIRVAVHSDVPGNIAEILVTEGARVKAGDVVARLERSALLTDLAMTKSNIASAQSQLAELQNGPGLERVRQARETVLATETEIAHLTSRNSRYERLRQQGLLPQDTWEQAQSELAIRRGALRAAVDEARLVEKGTRPERIQAAQAEVARLETLAADITRRLAACELRAPVSGVVLTPKVETHRGEFLAAGGQLMEVADVDQLVADVNVLESEIGDVRTGAEVRLRFGAFPDRNFTGRVVEIAPVAARDGLGRAAFVVRCAVEDPAKLLRPGMTGAAKVLAGHRPLAALVARRALRLIDPSLL